MEALAHILYMYILLNENKLSKQAGSSPGE